MARSQYIYTIIDPGEPPAGFTVKHELVRWLRHHPGPEGRQVWRLRDGIVKGDPVLLDTEELLSEKTRT